MSGIWLIFVPLLLTMPSYLISKKINFAKILALVLSIVMLVWSGVLYTSLPQDGSYMELGSFLHVKQFDFVLHLAVDKLSVIMLLLSSLLLVLVTLASWSVQNSRGYFALIIFFAGAIFGVFMSVNLLWFFIFWELTLIPMFFLVGIWGAEGRIYAAVKFFLYTHVASMFLLLAFFLIYKQSGSFDMELFKESVLLTPALIWWLMFIGFAVKMPLFPFHTWLPDAHVQAPSAVSALLAGVLLKMGAYALIRFNLLLMPTQMQKYGWVIVLIGIVTLFFAGFKALYENHIKKMIAYSSISHMGLVAIAIGSATLSSLSSALFEMIAHALIISPLFIIAGFIHQKTSSWEMDEMGGIMQKAPYLSAMFIVAGLGALGLPGTMGFIGEISIFISAIQAQGVWIAFILFASMLASGYMIYSFRRVLYAQISSRVQLADFTMNKVEFFALTVFIFLIVLFGIFPSLLFDPINSAFGVYLAGGGA